MLGAIVFAIVAWLASLWIKKPLALAVGGGIAGCVWTAPHIPAAMGLTSWAPVAFGALVGIGALCLVTLILLISKLRARGYHAASIADDPFGPEEIPHNFAGLERHFNRDIAGPARMPGMLRSGYRQARGLAASDVAFAARGIATLRARWAGNRRGKGGRPVESAPLGRIRRGRVGGGRHDGRAAA